MEVYIDADWARSIDDSRATPGYFTFLGGSLVTCRRKNTKCHFTLGVQKLYTGEYRLEFVKHCD